jgi:predicted flap endonuclease-1-like 5' DNA nuclease
MPPLLSEVTREAVGHQQTGADSAASPAGRVDGEPVAGGQPHARAADGALHISKLRGMTARVRARLKRQGITYTDQLLAAAGPRGHRWQLAVRSGIDGATLARLACRADLIRIKGIGAIFADMLELLGVDRLGRLARQDPAELHRALLELNAAERFARRAPTPDEVRHWIAQARVLPPLVEDGTPRGAAMRRLVGAHAPS